MRERTRETGGLARICGGCDRSMQLGAIFLLASGDGRLSRYVKDATPMERNRLYMVIGALAIALVVIGGWLYQERQKTSGIDINVGRGGITIQTK